MLSGYCQCRGLRMESGNATPHPALLPLALRLRGYWREAVVLKLAAGSSSLQALAVSLDHLAKYHPFGPNLLLK